MDGESQMEGRIEGDFADFLGMADVADVENDEFFAVRKIGEIADDHGRTVKSEAVRECGVGRVGIGKLLLGQPPAADFDRMRGIADIGNDVDVAGESVGAGSEMHVAAAVVAVAMRAKAAGFEMSEELRMDGILDIPDEHAFVPGLGVVGVAAKLGAFERGDHFALGHVDLHGEGVGRARNPVDHGGLGGIGDVENAPAAVVEAGGVKIPAALHFLDGELERNVAVLVGIADEFDVLGEGAGGEWGAGGRLRARVKKSGNDESGKEDRYGETAHGQRV